MGLVIPEASAQQPSTQVAPIAGEIRIGSWRIVPIKERLTAMANATKWDGEQLAGLWLVCSPGGRLQYHAVALKLFDPIKSLWVNQAGDVFSFRLTQGVTQGSDAASISKILLKEEAAYQSQNTPFTMDMSIDSDNGPWSTMQLEGFSKVRAHMLSNCKS